MSFEAFDPSWFGEDAEQVTLHDARDAYIEEAKSVVLDRLRTTIVDQNGKRISEKRWRYLNSLVESL
jgi:uncharacterized protein YnzC (UPF0291/DUF896 family)